MRVGRDDASVGLRAMRVARWVMVVVAAGFTSVLAVGMVVGPIVWARDAWSVAGAALMGVLPWWALVVVNVQRDRGRRDPVEPGR